MNIALALGFAGLFFPVLVTSQELQLATTPQVNAANELPVDEMSAPTCDGKTSAYKPINGLELSYAASGIKFPSALLPAADIAAKDCFEEFLRQVSDCGSAASNKQMFGYNHVVINRHNYFSGYTDFQIDVALTASNDLNVPLQCSARINEARAFEIDTVKYDRDLMSELDRF